MRWALAISLLLLGAPPQGPLTAQQPAAAAASPRPARLRLFLDCATDCDRAYLRTEIRIVEWVSDRNASDLHVLATSLEDGAGGDAYTLTFFGRGGALEGLTDRFTFRTAPDATDDEVRREFARVLRLGLVRYLLAADQGAALALVEDERDATEAAVVAPHDPWKNWVFNVQLDGQYDAESQEKGTEIELQFNASRITDAWKIAFELSGTHDRNSYILDDGERFQASKDRWNGDLLVGRSLGPQWTIGVVSAAQGEKPENLDLRLRLAPVIEYDLFPYAEAQRRRLILQYSVGINHYDYVEETIYDELSETRVDHRLRMEYRTRQPWGGASLTGTTELFAHDLDQYRLGVDGSFTIRIAKGLGFEIEGAYSKVRNQITLPKGDATDEEIFLDLRQRATDYRASITIGISYTFGSFLNTIVNPRFNNLQ
ncbi:MAG: hypothetical protein SFU84_07515 [Gemmatimonadales bacterium]|nr:hypothetical protein [Gemmatimonadales bacterium]